MFKKAALGGIVVFAFLVYVLHHKSEQNRTITIGQPTNYTIPATDTAPTNTPMGQPMMSQQNMPMHQAGYKDGTYTGSVADAFYGNIQVQATISNGKITDVQFLQYPNDRPTSIEINSQAMPLLKQEAIAAQSSQVDIISGATQTSNAFIESLASALSHSINL